MSTPITARRAQEIALGRSRSAATGELDAKHVTRWPARWPCAA
jgi:hypothetical protein